MTKRSGQLPPGSEPHLTPLSHDARHNCFGCGQLNRSGLRLRFFVDAQQGGIVCTLKLAARFQGPHGLAHGGIIATLLDEAMSKAVHATGARAMTRHMEVDYLRPVPLARPIELHSRVVSVEGRKHFCEARIVLAGRELARGKGLFIGLENWSAAGQD